MRKRCRPSLLRSFVPTLLSAPFTTLAALPVSGRKRSAGETGGVWSAKTAE